MSAPARSIVLAALSAALLLNPLQADAGRRSRAATRRAAAASIPAHPDQLKFPPLTYEAPVRTGFRHVLSSGIPVYVVPDHALPLVNIDITSRTGSYMDPPGAEGLAAATANQMRDGGAGELDAESFDEEIDFLAINFGINAGDRESSASMNLLSKDLDAGLDLLFAALRTPRFQQDRFDLYRKRIRQNLERRNDSTQSIEQREWFRLMYGEDHFESAAPTGPSLDGLSRDDLKAFHAKAWHPGQLIIAVSGDVEADEILPRLEKRMAGWEKGPAAPPIPPSTKVADPGVYVINKPDVNQTRVRIGHRSTTWDHPDAIALEVMNRILGGGAFTSRITKRVRSDEGLAYSAGSGWGQGRDYPRTFVALFQSKNQSVPQAVSIVMEEIERMRQEPVSQEELDTAINYYVESFPQRFNSASAKADTFLTDEIWGRPADYWTKYRDAVRAVSREDVQRVAKEHLHPGALAVLVVGKIDEVVAGDPDKPEYRLEEFASDGGILEIPLPDPLTLKYPHQPRPLLPEASVEAGGMGS